MFKSFNTPWVQAQDVEYMGRGRYQVEALFVRGCFFNNVVVELT